MCTYVHCTSPYLEGQIQCTSSSNAYIDHSLNHHFTYSDYSKSEKFSRGLIEPFTSLISIKLSEGQDK